MSRVRWTEQAVTDVQAIRHFIERDSPRYGRIVAEYRIVYRLDGNVAVLLTIFRSSRLFPADLKGLVVWPPAGGGGHLSVTAWRMRPATGTLRSAAIRQRHPDPDGP